MASEICFLPPVKRHIKKLSTVPKANSPISALLRAPGTLSNIQLIFVAEKYGSISNPEDFVISCAFPDSWIFSQILEVRLSCQTIALYMGLPLLRSQIIEVSL